jgi:hypothetical protein
MKLTKRGEVVFSALLASFLFSLLVMAVGAVVAGVTFLSTHHTVIDPSTCKQVAEGTMCDFHYERNK